MATTHLELFVSMTNDKTAKDVLSFINKEVDLITLTL
jgi:hypothetical protein